MGIIELQAEWVESGKLDTLGKIYSEVKVIAKRETRNDEVSHNVAAKIVTRYLEDTSFRISNNRAYISRCIFTELYGVRKNRRESAADIQRDDLPIIARECADAIAIQEEPQDYARDLFASADGKTILYCIAICATFKKAIKAADARGVSRRFIRDNAVPIIAVWRVTHGYAAEYFASKGGGGIIRGLQREMRGAGGYKKGRRGGELARLLGMVGRTEKRGDA